MPQTRLEIFLLFGKKKHIVDLYAFISERIRASIKIFVEMFLECCFVTFGNNASLVAFANGLRSNFLPPSSDAQLEREIEGEREIEIERDRESDRETEREIEGEREIERETERERQRERQREREKRESQIFRLGKALGCT